MNYQKTVSYPQLLVAERFQSNNWLISANDIISFALFDNENSLKPTI